MRSFMKVIFFMMLVGMLCESAQATVTIGGYVAGGPITITNEQNVTLSEINTSLSSWLSANPVYGNLTDYMEETEPNTWLIRKCFHLYNSTVEFNGSKDCSVLKLGTTQMNPGGMPDFGTTDNVSSMVFTDVIVECWNETSGARPVINPAAGTAAIDTIGTIMTKITANNIISNNCTFYGLNVMTISHMDSDLSNVNISDSYKGFEISNLNNKKVYGIRCTNIANNAFAFGNTSNCEIYNYVFHNDPSYRVGFATSRNAISIGGSGTYGNYVHDLTIDSPRWGGVYFSTGQHDNVVKNVTASYCGHNAIDVHAGYNTTVENVTEDHSFSNAYAVTGPWEPLSEYPEEYPRSIYNASLYGCYNTTLKNITSYYPSAAGVTIGTNVSHTIVENFTLTNPPGVSRDGIKAGATDNVTVYNLRCVDVSGSAWYMYVNSIDTILFDSYIKKITGGYGEVIYENSSNGSLINVFTYYNDHEHGRSDYKNGYYFDLCAKYANGTALSNYEYSLTCNNSSYTSTDATGTNETLFTLDSTGRTINPKTSRSESPVVYNYYHNNGTTYYVKHNLSVAGVTLDNIIIDSRHYRPNISQSNYTITALINDSQDLHLTGYAPSPEFNNYSEGERVKMQVWGSKPLTRVVWKVDGVEKQNSTATTYETTMGIAPVTVDLIGSTDTETITKSWVLDPTQTIEPESPETPLYPPVANFTSDVTNGTIPLKVQFNDSSENATAWYWDIDNNGRVDYFTQNCTHTYRTQGNYTVKLTVSNSEGMNYTTKTEYIQAEKQSWYIIFWNFFFGVAGGVIAG